MNLQTDKILLLNQVAFRKSLTVKTRFQFFKELYTRNLYQIILSRHRHKAKGESGISRNEKGGLEMMEFMCGDEEQIR